MTAKTFATWFAAVFGIALTAALALQSFGSNTFGASVFATFQGGTGTSSPSGILYGSGSATPLQTVIIGPNLTFSAGTLSATDTNVSTSTNPFMATYFVATSTNVASRFPYASTTAWSITSTSTGTSGINLSGGCFAVNGTCLSSSSGTVTSITAGSGLSGGTITTSGTIALVWPWNISSTFSTTTNATTTPSWFLTGMFASSTSQFSQSTTTLLTAASALWVPNSAASCINGLGSLCFDTTDFQLQIGTSTAFASVFSPYQFLRFSYSTSTAWAGTTTRQLGPEWYASVYKDIVCYTDTGTLNAQLLYNASAMTMLNASTTMGTTTLSTNNQVPAGAKISVNIGTPASTPTVIACTVRKTTNPT